MLFCMAWVFNFLFGGISGVFLSDVPSDVTLTARSSSMAHFHYTIMGGLIFTFFAAIYYWGPKMTGYKFSEQLGKIHFWTMFIAFNSTFAPLFALGFLGMPRRVDHLPVEPPGAEQLGLGVGVLSSGCRCSSSSGSWSRRWSSSACRGAQPLAFEVGRVAAADAGAGVRLQEDPDLRRRSVPVRRAIVINAGGWP